MKNMELRKGLKYRYKGGSGWHPMKPGDEVTLISRLVCYEWEGRKIPITIDQFVKLFELTEESKVILLMEKYEVTL